MKSCSTFAIALKRQKISNELVELAKQFENVYIDIFD